MAELLAHSGDPDQMPHNVGSDQGLHCLPITLLEQSDLGLHCLPMAFCQKLWCLKF